MVKWLSLSVVTPLAVSDCVKVRDPQVSRGGSRQSADFPMHLVEVMLALLAVLAVLAVWHTDTRSNHNASCAILIYTIGGRTIHADLPE